MALRRLYREISLTPGQESIRRALLTAAKQAKEIFIISDGIESDGYAAEKRDKSFKKGTVYTVRASRRMKRRVLFEGDGLLDGRHILNV